MEFVSETATTSYITKEASSQHGYEELGHANKSLVSAREVHQG